MWGCHAASGSTSMFKSPSCVESKAFPLGIVILINLFVSLQFLHGAATVTTRNDTSTRSPWSTLSFLLDSDSAQYSLPYLYKLYYCEYYPVLFSHTLTWIRLPPSWTCCRLYCSVHTYYLRIVARCTVCALRTSVALTNDESISSTVFHIVHLWLVWTHCGLDGMSPVGCCPYSYNAVY